MLTCDPKWQGIHFSYELGGWGGSAEARWNMTSDPAGNPAWAALLNVGPCSVWWNGVFNVLPACCEVCSITALLGR